jgi:hypothetical protein
MSTKETKNKFVEPHAGKDNPTDNPPNESNSRFYFVPFVDELRFLG